MHLFDHIGPIIGIIALGFYCGRKAWFNADQIEGFESFLFKIALPCYLFSKTSNLTISELVYWPYVACITLAFIIISIFVILFFYYKCNLPNILIRILSAGYVNAAFYGVPVLTFVLGNPEAAVLSNLLQIVVINTTFMVLLSSLIGRNEKPVLIRVLNSILTPIILMPVIGMILTSLDLKLPIILITITDSLGLCTTSMALFSFGLSINNIQFRLKDLTAELFFMIILKSILHPFVTYLVGFYIFNLQGYWLKAAVIMSSAPTAFLIYFIAKQFNTDNKIVKSTIALTSICSLISLIIITVIF